MKIQTRDVGLVVLGFVIGALVTVRLTLTPPRMPATPALRVVATGPRLASASLPTRFGMLDNSFDAQSPLYPPMRRPVDLIDTHYQPDFKLDDLH